MKVNNNDISNQIVNAMSQYSDAVKAEIQTELKSIADTALSKVKASSPRRTGKYQRGWRMMVETDGGTVKMTVYQKKPQYRLTHLLEEGHKKRGGRGFVSAKPHIREIEEWAEAEAMKKIEKAVKG